MNENENISIGEVLKKIRGGDLRRQIRLDEESGDFVVVSSDEPEDEGSQNVTDFAEEGFA